MTSDPWSCPDCGRTKRLWVHHFRITEPSAFDDEFVGWIGESFDVGEGRHLQHPI